MEELEKMDKGYEAQRQASGAGASLHPMAAKNRAVLKRYKNQVRVGGRSCTGIG